jgi:glycosyltransferase involved in cell wall biosynthesis
VSSPPRLSVVVVTQERAAVLGQCLDHLARQDTTLLEAVLIDSSSDASEAAARAASYPWAAHYAVGPVPRNMQLARNVGLVLARAPVVAFIDDDCFVRGAWLSEILALIDRPGVAAVGGRVVDRRWESATPGKARAGEVGVVRDDGRVVSGFFSLTDAPITVQHLPGGNAAVRRDVALALDGFDPGYRGTNFREDTDFYYRVHAAGHTLLYSSTIEVYHAAASKAGHGFGTRESLAIKYWEAHNHAAFLKETVGWSRRAVLASQLRRVIAGSLPPTPARLVTSIEQVRGVVAGALQTRPRRRGAIAEAMRFLQTRNVTRRATA